jgi:hypothetical protein
MGRHFSLIGAADTEVLMTVASFLANGACITSNAELLNRGTLAARDLLRKSAIAVVRMGLPATRSEFFRFPTDDTKLTQYTGHATC